MDAAAGHTPEDVKRFLEGHGFTVQTVDEEHKRLVPFDMNVGINHYATRG